MASRGKTAQLSQMNVADFETCDSDIPYNETYLQRVWLAGYMNLESMKWVYFTNIDEFMTSILSRGQNINSEYAFHNIKFDGSYIIPWLFKNGFTVTQEKPGPKEFTVLIDDRNNWFSITIQVTAKRRVLLWDSLKLFPQPLAQLHQIYGTPTKKVAEDQDFYELKRPEGYIPDERELRYFEADLRVLAETLNAHIDFYGLQFKKTQASQAFNDFEKHFPCWKLRFPALDQETDQDIRKAYWGGISYANKLHQGKNIEDGIIVYDINSSYPYQLAYKRLPYGPAIKKWGEGIHPDMSKFWIAEAIVSFRLKPGKVPCIPSKALSEGKPIGVIDKWLDDSQGLVKMKFCNIDYQTIQQSYEFKVIRWKWSIHFAWKVQKEIQSFILHNNEIKVKHKALYNETGNLTDITKSNRAKITNNSFYGKFGEEIVKEGKTPHEVGDDIQYLVDRYEVIREGKRKYLPVAIATTAWGRQQLITMANAVEDNLLYCDTDSIHMKEAGLPLVDSHIKDGTFKVSETELGDWKLEGRFDRGRYLRAKCYYEEIHGKTPEVTVAGLPVDKGTDPRRKIRSACSWEAFHIGLKVYNCKLRTLRTPTGNKLVLTDFHITETESIFF